MNATPGERGARMACTEHQDCCPHEDCPWPVEPGAADCGEHEEGMT